MRDETIPEPVTEEERWIVANIVTAIRIEYRQTGVDTADTYVHLTGSGDKPETRCWRDHTFNRVAQLRLGYNSCAEPKYGVREKVEARVAWEKKNAAELATYERLKAKFGP